MSGFPNRETRSSFGPAFEDERPRANAKKELGASQLNHTFWNVAGLQTACPLIVIQIDSSDVTQVVYAAATWDDTVYQNAAVSTIPWITSIVKNGVGDFSVNFATIVQDMNETWVNLVLTHAIGQTQGIAASPRNVTTQADPSTYSVRLVTFEGSGSPSAVDNDVMIVVW